MSVSRVAKGTQAIMAIGVDEAPTAEVSLGLCWVGFPCVPLAWLAISGGTQAVVDWARPLRRCDAGSL